MERSNSMGKRPSSMMESDVIFLWAANNFNRQWLHCLRISGIVRSPGTLVMLIGESGTHHGCEDCSFNLPTTHPAHPNCPPLCAFAKKGGKSFTDTNHSLTFFFSPWAASVKWNTKVATIKYLRNRLYNPLVFPKCRELETLLTDPLWNLLRSWASLGAGPGW